jgi:hypothetical protein
LESLPEKPAECNIKEAVGPEGVTLSWQSHSVRPFWRQVAFLMFWLCGWMVCLIYAVLSFLNGGPQAFLIFWVSGWIIAGGLALRALRALLRPARSVSVRLEADLLQYDSGSRVYNPDDTVIMFTRSDIKQILLDQLEGEQRLRLDLGCNWFDIGAGLREPDLKWLFAVLHRWYTAKPITA